MIRTSILYRGIRWTGRSKYASRLIWVCAGLLRVP